MSLRFTVTSESQSCRNQKNKCQYYSQSFHCSVVLKLGITVWRLAKVAIFTTNVDAENQTLINHKCVFGALNRHFCQTPVSGSAFFSSSCQSMCFKKSFHSFFNVKPNLLMFSFCVGEHSLQFDFSFLI